MPRYFNKERSGRRIDEAKSRVIVSTLQHDGFPLISRSVENLNLYLFAIGIRDSFRSSSEAPLWRVAS
jgi:hypothetical protein